MSESVRRRPNPSRPTMEPAPEHPLGTRVSAEIGRLESLLLRVGAEFSDDEGDEDEDEGQGVAGMVQGHATGSAAVAGGVEAFTHIVEPRPCTPLGARPRSRPSAVPPPRPRTPQSAGGGATAATAATAGGSPRQRVANVYTRAAAAVSAEQAAAAAAAPRFPSGDGGIGSAGGGDGSEAMDAAISRNIADARQALDQLEQCVRPPPRATMQQPCACCACSSGTRDLICNVSDSSRDEKRDERSSRMLCRARGGAGNDVGGDVHSFGTRTRPGESLW